MPVDKQLIKEKLEKIDDYLRRIENMDFSEQDLYENRDYQDLLTFRLQQAVETVIEIATHIIAGQKFEKPENARSTFEVLAKEKIIDDELARRLTYAVSFRNLAVHGYDKFDFKRLFHDYKEDLKDLKEFIAVVMVFLK